MSTAKAVKVVCKNCNVELELNCEDDVTTAYHPIRKIGPHCSAEGEMFSIPHIECPTCQEEKMVN